MAEITKREEAVSASIGSVLENCWAEIFLNGGAFTSQLIHGVASCFDVRLFLFSCHSYSELPCRVYNTRSVTEGEAKLLIMVDRVQYFDLDWFDNQPSTSRFSSGLDFAKFIFTEYIAALLLAIVYMSVYAIFLNKYF